MTETADLATTIAPPPYLMTGVDFIQIGVIWDEVAKTALPPSISATNEMTGGINIYRVTHGRVLGTYQAAYLWLDVEGYDSPDGYKGRWMLAGLYGPDRVTSDALKTYYGLPVRVGTSSFESTQAGQCAIGVLNGRNIVTAHVKSGTDPFGDIAGLLNYVSLSSATGAVIVNQIPFISEARTAEALSVAITAPSDDPFGLATIKRIDWALEGRNGTISFSWPRTF